MKNIPKSLKHTKSILTSHDSDKHEIWFHEQVNIALLEADSTQAIWLKAEDVRSRMKVRAKSWKISIND